jgi:uncharacterized protein
MRYRLLRQLKGPEGYARCEIDDPVPPGTGWEWRGPVRGTVELERMGAAYCARGRLEATVVLACSRCAAPHALPLTVDLTETVSLAQIDEPQSYQAAEVEPPIPILNGEIVDLSELVRQMLVLAVPARSLCRPDCRGICPYCGTDLNEATCGCTGQSVDPRLEALRKLL